MGNICKIKMANVINLGSTYGAYDFVYDEINKIKCLNLAGRPQYLDCDLRIVRKYGKYLKKGVKVLIVLPDFVFAADSYKMQKNCIDCYNLLWPWEIEKCDIIRWILQRGKKIIKIILKKDALKRIPIDTEKAAIKRINDWEKALQIPSFSKAEISDTIKQNIENNIMLLDRLIDCIYTHGGEPFIVIPPVSGYMNSLVTRECIEAYLLNPIERRNDKSVKVLNHLYDEKYQNNNMYFNADCLTIEAGRSFTLDILKEIEAIKNEF